MPEILWPTRVYNVRLTPHFRLSEWRCNDGAPVPVQFIPRVQKLAEALEVLRAELGDSQIQIISGYRTPEYNLKVGGAAKSQHMQARAADIRVRGFSPWQVHATIERLIKADEMPEGGLGLYKTFIHYDIRGKHARWKGQGV